MVVTENWTSFKLTLPHTFVMVAGDIIEVEGKLYCIERRKLTFGALNAIKSITYYVKAS